MNIKISFLLLEIIFLSYPCISVGSDYYIYEKYFNTEYLNKVSENISLPKCEIDDPEVAIIRDKHDLYLLNSKVHNVFCIVPGDYTSAGNILLKRSGSEFNKRYIRSYNPLLPGSSSHPYHLPLNHQVILESITFDNASYWVVDSITVKDSPKGQNPILLHNSSSNNILNKMLITHFVDNGVLIKNGANFNTIQNTVIGEMNMSKGVDHVCIGLEGRSLISDSIIQGTRIIDNEIMNCNDGIMTITDPRLPTVSDFPSTYIANNDIYITNKMYSDCNGNKDINGLCACAENAIDLKGGSSIKESPITIIGNRMWGYRKTDKKCGGSGSWGEVIAAHFGVDNLQVVNNIIFDSPRGISFVDQLNNVLISGNIFHTIIKTHENTGFAMVLSQPKNSQINTASIIENNIIIDSFYSIIPSLNDLVIRSNIFLNVGMQPFGRAENLNINSNIYINTPKLHGEKNKYQEKINKPTFEKLCFKYELLTAAKEKCLNDADVKFQDK